jgi:hypothetical protein
MRNATVVSGALARFFTFRLYSWQRLFMGWCGLGKKYAANRVVFDRFGNAGKSVMIEYMQHLGLAYEMPLLREKKDIARCASHVKHYQMYVVDMLAGARKTNLKVFYSEIARLKNVTVFTNVMPSKAVLTKGNWELWELTERKTLARSVFVT